MRASSFHVVCIACIIFLCVLIARGQECDNEVDLQLLQVDLQADAVKTPGLLAAFFNAQSAVPLAQFQAVGEGLQQLGSKLGNATARQKAWEAMLYAANAQTVAPSAEFHGAGLVLQAAEEPENNLSLEQSRAVSRSRVKTETSAAKRSAMYILLGVAALLLLGGLIYYTTTGTKFTESVQNKTFLQPAQQGQTQRKDCC